MSEQCKVRVRVTQEQLDKAKLMVLNDSSNDQLTNVYDGVKLTDNQDGTLTLEGDVYDIGDFEHELFGTTEAVNDALVIEWEIGVLDSLYAAKRMLDLAISMYESAKGRLDLNRNGGPLFGTNDYLDAAKQEIEGAMGILQVDDYSGALPQRDMDGGPFPMPEPTDEDRRLYELEQQEQIEAAREDYEQKLREHQQELDWLKTRVCLDCNGDGYLMNGVARDDYGTPRPMCLCCKGSGRIAK